MSEPRIARQDFRVLTRRRGGTGGADVVDVQLQVAATGALVWAQTFSDEGQADRFHDEVEADLNSLDTGEFRRKYGVPTGA